MRVKPRIHVLRWLGAFLHCGWACTLSNGRLGRWQDVATTTKKTVHSTFENVPLFSSKACMSTVVEKGRFWLFCTMVWKKKKRGIFCENFITKFKVKGEVRRKMNFTYVRVCGVEGSGKSLFGQFFFVCEKEDREESSTKSLGGMTWPKDEMGSQIVFSESDISYPILVYQSRNNHSQAQAQRFPALTAPEPEFAVIFGSKWDPLTSAWCQGGARPERLAELPTGVSPLQKRIWKWDFYHCSSCNFFFHICFCHLWCELPLWSWSNVPLKFLACIRFLFKVVHENGRLRKFNRAREIEFNFFIDWTISMKFGTLAHHVPGYKTLLRFHNFCLGTWLWSFKVKKNTG